MPKNIPGIVKRSRRRQGEKVRILVQPNPYPLEQPAGQPNVFDPMNPQMQPNGYSPMNPQMQPNGYSPVNPQAQQPGGAASPVPQPMQPGGYGPTPQMPQGVSMTPAPGQVVPMQSSGQWRSDPNGQIPLQQGSNQQWQGGPGAPNGMGNNQPIAPMTPMTPPQMQRPSTDPLPYNNNNNMPVQQGRGTPANNIPSRPPYQPGQTPEPQYSPQRLQPNPSRPLSSPQYSPVNQQYSPVAAVPQPAAAPRMPSNSGLLGRPSPASLPGLAGTPAASTPTPHIFVEIDGRTVQEVRLDRPVFTVGRQDGRDIQIKHQSVSRTHARIIAENGNWFVEDAGSVNGIVLDGKRVHRAVINNGDRVFVAPNIALLYKMM